MVRPAAVVLLAAILSASAGAGLAMLASGVAGLRLFEVPKVEVLHGGDSEQVLRRLSYGLRLDSEVVLQQPVGEWEAGARLTLLDLITTQDNDELLRLALGLAPEVDTQVLVQALCTAARKGHGSTLPVLADRIAAPPETVACAQGRRPSELAAANRHDGASALLRARGL